MAKVFPPAAPDGDAASIDEELWQSRLRVATYDFDDPGCTTSEDDDGEDRPSEISLRNLHFKRGEAETVCKVLKEIEEIALKRRSEGFNEVNFTFGVLNCLLIPYVLGAFPQHLWLLYLLESFFHLPRRFYNQWRARPLNQALYYLDFCWCMNFLMIIVLALFVLCGATGISVGETLREMAFEAAVGVACGVLLTANVALPFVACLFHDVNSMTSVFIHLMPPLVVYTLRWHTDDIVSSWGNVFDLSYTDQTTYFGGLNSVAGCSTALYFLWFVSYVAFMLVAGINLPKKYKPDGREANPKWDTVFHSTMRQGACIAIGRYLRGRKKADSLKQMEANDFDVTDFFAYMTMHMVAALGSIYTVGYASFVSKYFHASMLGLSVVLAVVRGAQRYTYYTTKMYSGKLSRQFAHMVAAGDKGEAEYSRMA